MINFSVHEITDKSQLADWLLYKHYAKRMPSISFSFGLYDANVLVGVLTIGKPSSPHLCDGICGEGYRDFVYELNRLCVNDGLPKNTLSWFLTQTVKLIAQKFNMILVSYADTERGHIGYIYQATNFIYTGAPVAHDAEYVIDGHRTHARTLTGQGITNPRAWAKQNDIEIILPSAKHRYVMFIGRRKKEFCKALKYPILPYPKGDNQRYDASFTPITQPRLFCERIGGDE